MTEDREWTEGEALEAEVQRLKAELQAEREKSEDLEAEIAELLHAIDALRAFGAEH